MPKGSGVYYDFWLSRGWSERVSVTLANDSAYFLRQFRNGANILVAVVILLNLTGLFWFGIYKVFGF